MSKKTDNAAIDHAEAVAEQVMGAGTPAESTAGGKRKGPRAKRTPARAAVYLERQIMRYPLAQRRAIYSLLASVCEATLTDTEATP